MKNKKNINKKGFTLLEILLVITFIGVLASIILIAINPVRQLAEARNAKRFDDINKINQALEDYFVANRTYPTGITGVYQDICPQSGGSNCINLNVLVPDYIATIPIAPNASGGTTGYTVSINPQNKQLALKAGNAELGSVIEINFLSCPAGYIKVPNNPIYNTGDFCVMKYEAKAVAIAAPTVGLTTPNTINEPSDPTYWNTIDNTITATTAANGRAVASVASGYPIAKINQITAADYCANQNTVSGSTLITNTEWMTIARNIEAQLSNWTTGIAASSAIGIGGLYRGHEGTTNALVAGPDTDGYIGTGESGFSIKRRTHTLSNGEVIWDLSGNVGEWVNNTIMGADKPTNALPPGGWQQWPSINNFGTLSYDLTRPSNNTWDTTQNVGQYLLDDLTGGPFAFFRGGVFFDETSPGIFSLDLRYLPSADTTDLYQQGFRCVIS